MQTARILQAVILMMIVAMAASCAASKEYTSKLFAPRTPVIKDSQVLAVAPLRFLELDSALTNQEDWVTTDIIMGRDTATNTIALDNLARILPVNRERIDTIVKSDPGKTTPSMTEVKNTQVETAPVAKAANPGEVRNKRSREK